MVPVREGGGAMALIPWCDAAGTALVRLVGRLPDGMGALSDTAALSDRGISVVQRSCSARDEGRCLLRAWRRSDGVSGYEGKGYRAGTRRRGDHYPKRAMPKLHCQQYIT